MATGATDQGGQGKERYHADDRDVGDDGFAEGAKVKEDRMINNESDKEMVERIKANPNFTAFEPAIILRGGGENVKVQVGFSFSKLSGHLVDVTETEILSVGVSINIKNRKKL